jgi:predicted HTH domain antitoxin
MARVITLEVPDELATLWGSDEKLVQGAKELFVLDAFRRREISAGKASEWLGISLWEFHQLAQQHQISLIEMDTEELQRELQITDQLFGQGAH